MTNLPMIRTSERRDFRRCPQRWWWSWREGLRQNGVPAPALWFGTGIHLALAEWYKPREVTSKKTGAVKKNGFKRSIDPRETWSKYIDDEIAWIKTTYRAAEGEAFEEEWVNAKELGEIMLANYIDWYGEDEYMEFIEPEQSGEVIILDPKTREQLALYCFTFDGVYRDHSGRNPEIKLIEHKTAAQISTKHLSLDDQAGSYWALADAQLHNDGKIKKNEHLAGVTYNFLRKAKPDARPINELGQALNKNGSVSKVQPAVNLLRYEVGRNGRERNTQIKRIVAEAKHMNAVRSGYLPLYKNPTKDCSWDCAFFQMCELHESGDDWEEFRDLGYHVEDPYHAHRETE